MSYKEFNQSDSPWTLPVDRQVIVRIVKGGGLPTETHVLEIPDEHLGKPWGVRIGNEDGKIVGRLTFAESEAEENK